MKELKATEPEPLTAVLKACGQEQEEKTRAAAIHNGAYIISGSSFRMLVHDLFDLLVLYNSLRNRVLKAETELQVKCLQKGLAKELPMNRRMYRRWGIPGSTDVTGYDILACTIHKTHLTSYDLDGSKADYDRADSYEYMLSK